MKKTFVSLATASGVVALALTFAAPLYAQTNTTGSSTLNTTGGVTNTSNTSGTGIVNTSGTGASTNSTVNPGLPNTGAGGQAAENAALLLSSGIIAVGGTLLIARKLAA
jgi:hypothetical protein